MTVTEVRDVLRILAGIGDKIRKFEIEALFRVLVAHTGQNTLKHLQTILMLEQCWIC